MTHPRPGNIPSLFTLILTAFRKRSKRIRSVFGRPVGAGFTSRFAQTSGSPELKKTRTGPIGGFGSPPVACLRIRSVAGEQQEITVDSVQLGREPGFSVLILEGQSAGQARQSVTKVTTETVDLRKQPVVERQPDLRAYGLQTFESSAQTHQPGRRISSPSHRPPGEDLCPRQIIGKSIFAAERGRLLCLGQRQF